MVDLKFNYPTIDEEAELIKDFCKSTYFESKQILSYPSNENLHNYKSDIYPLLKLPENIFPQLINIVICNGGNHALSCTLRSLRKNHKNIITDRFFYSFFKLIASELGYDIYSCGSDEEGMVIDELETIIDETKATLIYLQPTIHNPTNMVMSLDRKRKIAELANKKDIIIIEDDAYRFLHTNPTPRFIDLIPEQTFHIFSLSKPFNSLIRTAFLIYPDKFSNSINESIKFTSSGNSNFLNALALYILSGNKYQNIVDKKRELARNLQKIVLPLLNGLVVNTYPGSFHIWIDLPETVKSSDVVLKLAAEDIMISDGLDFLIDKQYSGNHIRIAIGTEKNRDKLKYAINKLREIIKGSM